MMPEDTDKTLDLTAYIVSSYLTGHGNQMRVEEIPALISAVHASLSGLMTGGTDEVAPAEPQKPAVPIKRSVHPDHIVCLEDGKRLKMLKRHLSATYGMTPAEYRAKWGLPTDYPMVAPEYAARRSEFAKTIGLGQSRKRA